MTAKTRSKRTAKDPTMTSESALVEDSQSAVEDAVMSSEAPSQAGAAGADSAKNDASNGEYRENDDTIEGTVDGKTDSGEGETANDVETPEGDEAEPSAVLSEKLQSLLTPISADTPAGEDPRYGDRFVLIKQEIDKFADNDFSLIVPTAEDLLKEDAKDMRIAGYYLFANTYIHGVEGLADGVTLYSEMLKRFGLDVHPRKASARVAALNWLDNAKLKLFLEDLADALDLESVTVLERGIQSITEQTETIIGERHSACGALSSILERRKPALLEAEQAKAKAELPALANPVDRQVAAGAGTGTRDARPAGDIDSDAALTTTLRGGVKYLLDRADYRRAVALSRAVRWTGLSMPPSENMKTRIPVPRASALAEVERLTADGDFATALVTAEQLFFEPGMHVWFDLQYRTIEIARKMNQPDVVTVLEHAMRLLFDRLPGLAALTFDDGTPFASPATKSWIGSMAEEQSDVANVTCAEADEALGEVMEEAQNLASDKNVSAGLAMLQRFPAMTRLQQFKVRMAMAQLCLEHGQSALAAHTVEWLSEHAQQTSLATWYPDLAFSIEKMRLSLLSERLVSVQAEEKGRIEALCEEARTRLCEIDLSKAARLQ